MRFLKGLAVALVALASVFMVGKLAIGGYNPNVIRDYEMQLRRDIDIVDNYLRSIQ